MRNDYGYSEEDPLSRSYDMGMLRRILPFLRAYRMLLALSVLMAMLITGIDLAMPYVTKLSVDRYIVPTQVHQTGASRQERVLTVDANDPVVAQVIGRHKDLFRISGETATIPVEWLHRLDTVELSRLRHKDIAGLGWLAVLFVGLMVLNFGFNFVQVVAMEYAGQKIMHDLRIELYRHIQTLPVAFFNRHPVGRLVTRVTNDVQNMDELFTSVLTFLFKDFFLLVGIATVLIALSWRLALSAFVVLPVVAFASAHFAREAREVFRLLRVKVAEINTRFSETIGGMRIVQLFGQQLANYRRFQVLNRENYRAGMRQIQVLGMFLPLVEMLGVVAISVVIYVGGRGVLADSITLGVLVAFLSYIKMFFQPLRDIAEKYNILQNALASAERIFQILDTEPAPGEAPGTFRAGIEKIEEIAFDHVSFSYLPGEPVLQDVSFEIRTGETVAVVGATGSGKTTLIHLLAGFYVPNSGTIRINGRDLNALDPASVRSRLALIPQDPFLFSATIRENVFPAERSWTDADRGEVLRSAHCGALIDGLSRGLETVLAEGGASISSGERQLLSIARAFARRPDLAILDEATSYIDSQTEEKIQAALGNLMKGRTAIVIAHRLSTARHAQRILVMREGRIIESGTHPDLMRQRGAYFELNLAEQWQTRHLPGHHGL